MLFARNANLHPGIHVRKQNVILKMLRNVKPPVSGTPGRRLWKNKLLECSTAPKRRGQLTREFLPYMRARAYGLACGFVRRILVNELSKSVRLLSSSEKSEANVFW